MGECNCCTPPAENGCLVCGAPIVYGESQKRRCVRCNNIFVSSAVCAEGHYICDACHAAAADGVMNFLRFTPEKDPIALMEQVMRLPSIHMHGPEHHRLVPAVLLAAYRNCGGGIDLPKALAAAAQRGKQVPGGTCGYWGVCGAAAGAGIYASIVTGSNPLSAAAWTLPQKLTARVIERIASYGGVRCCKRTAFIAIAEAASWTRDTLGVDMRDSTPVCRWSAKNRECLGAACPFHSSHLEDNR
ncbi:MAG: hypothetical protein HUJ65_06450 [Oscillospiraceae bacterium]|nr:hypothetical protein [Oscillospiraceae bacterium]